MMTSVVLVLAGALIGIIGEPVAPREDGGPTGGADAFAS
jgi:hypothetical protein